MRYYKATDILDAVEDDYNARAAKKRKRSGKLGASRVGDPCDAYIGYSLRGFPDTPPDAKLSRIFELGHKIEPIIVRDLQRVPFLEVIEKDTLTGKQFYYEGADGHLVCYIDGLVWYRGNPDPWILEAKSMNLDRFSHLVRYGVRLAERHYYGQIQTAMALSGIKKCLFVTYCKNNSKYHMEVVDFDAGHWSYLQVRIELAMKGHVYRIGYDRADWRCKMCSKSEVCWKTRELEPEEITCRMCVHAEPVKDGRWFCTKHKREANEVCDDVKLFEAGDR